MNISLDYVIQSVDGVLLSAAGSTCITGVSTDSRRINPGSLFIALQGERFDAHDFIPEIIQTGIAAAVIISRRDCIPPGELMTSVILVQDTQEALQRLAACYRQLFSVPVVAVTGSVGKTTTKDILAQCLSPVFQTLKTSGNFNNEIGLPLTLLNMEAEHQAAVVEIGMRAPREIYQLAAILKPSYAIISNVEAVHLETMGSLENIARAKCEVLEFIRTGYFALINGDNDILMRTAAEYSCRVYTFGYQEKCDIQILSVDNDGTGIRVGLKLFACQEEFYLPVPVVQLATNLASAVGMAFLMGVGLPEIKTALADFVPGNQRMNIIPMDAGGLIIDDTYNANPLSTMAALEACQQMSRGRKKVAVLGDMMELGDYEIEGHKNVGKKAAELDIDIMVTIGERAKYYKEGAVEAGMSEKQIIHFTYPNEALKWIKENISPADVILFKASRGMQLDKLVQGFTT